MKEEEIWLPVSGYRGYYEVSNYGRVRSLTRKIERPNPKNPNIKTKYTYKGKIIPFWQTKKGYLRCTLNKGGVKKNYLAHQLVAKAFLPCNFDANADQINHIDTDKKNNFYRNLEWCTAKQNYDHAVKHGMRAWQKL